jgi:hypothetical protein
VVNIFLCSFELNIEIYRCWRLLKTKKISQKIMNQIPIEFTMNSPASQASQALRAAKKAAFTGISEEERRTINQDTAKRFENLGQALRELGCTGIIVSPTSVKYTRPA